MLTELQEKWLQALESGEYEQCRERLFDSVGYCCLGVAVKVMGYEFECNGEFLGEKQCLTNYLEIGLHDNEGFPDRTYASSIRDFIASEFKLKVGQPGLPLTALNDNGLTFKQIAQVIRKFPQAYFTGESE